MACLENELYKARFRRPSNSALFLNTIVGGNYQLYMSVYVCMYIPLADNTLAFILNPLEITRLRVQTNMKIYDSICPETIIY